MARSSDLARLLDRVGGAIAGPPCALLANRRRDLPQTAERIGIIQPTAIGDTLIASGCVEAIRQRYPDARIRFYHGANNAQAARMLVVSMDSIQTSFANPRKALAAMRAGKPDLVVDLTPWPNITALCARFAAPVCVGFAPRRSGRHRFFDIAVPHRTDRHETENLAALAAVFGAGPDYAMRIARQPFAPGADYDPERLVLCHMSAGGTRAADKAWPAEHWAALARALAAAGFRVGFTGVAGDQAVVDAVLARAGDSADGMISLCGRLRLPELAELLARVPLLVTVDTGVLHLAAAVNARSLGLHGPTRSWRWGSRADEARSIDSPHPAAGYINYGFEPAPGAARVMEAITPEMVIEAALEMLGERQQSLPDSRTVTHQSV